MKRLKVLVIIFFVVLLFGSKNANAQSFGTLSNFNTIKSMEITTFSDVKEVNWFYSGVKTVFDYGIMDGVGLNLYAPNRNLTKAQAITIAARVHAIYTKQLVSEIDSPFWYEKYFIYAQNNNLLPPSYTSVSDVSTQYITRSEIAYLFAQILSSQDTAAINDLAVPDIDEISAIYRESVQKMYSSGIIGGKSGGLFDGNGLATRAEIATIIGRLIDPLNRLAHDRNYNSEIVGQEGNIQNYSSVFQSGNQVYIVYWDKTFSRYNIAEYNTITKKTNIIYYGNILENKSHFEAPKIKSMYNRELYIVEADFDFNTYDFKSILKKISLDSYVVSKIFDGDYISGLTIYGDELYILTTKNNPDWDTSDQDAAYSLYDIRKIAGTNQYTLKSGEGWAYRLSGINGHLYYLAESKIMELDISTQAELPILQNVSTVSFYGNIAYYVERSGNVNKVMLNNITSKKLLYRGDTSIMGFPVDINYFNNSLYYNFDWIARIDEINAKNQWGSVQTKQNHINFGVFDGHFVYTDYNDNDYIASFKSEASTHKNLATWLFNQDQGTITSNPNDSTYSIPEVNSELNSVLSSKDIYAKCSSSVVYIEAYDSNSELLGTGSGFFITDDGEV